MCKTFFRRFLAVLLIVSVASSSCFALAFLPAYSTSSEDGVKGTGFMGILRSFTSDESESSSEGKCFTAEELEEMDAELAAAEEAVKANLFRFSIGPEDTWVVGTGKHYLGLGMGFHIGDFMVDTGVSYMYDFEKAMEDQPFCGSNFLTRLGIRYIF